MKTPSACTEISKTRIEQLENQELFQESTGNLSSDLDKNTIISRTKKLVQKALKQSQKKSVRN